MMGHYYIGKRLRENRNFQQVQLKTWNFISCALQCNWADEWWSPWKLPFPEDDFMTTARYCRRTIELFQILRNISSVPEAITRNLGIVRGAQWVWLVGEILAESPTPTSFLDWQVAVFEQKPFSILPLSSLHTSTLEEHCIQLVSSILPPRP